MIRRVVQQMAPDLIAAALADTDLSALGVHCRFGTDAEYLECGERLSDDVRARIETLRFYGRLLLAAAPRGDSVISIEHFSSAPAQVLQVPIDKLRLRKRAMNCLQRAQIRTVGDVVKTGTNALFSLPNCGKSTVHNILSALHEYTLDALDPRQRRSWQLWTSVGGAESDGVAIPASEVVADRGIADELERFLRTLPERERNIVMARLGMNGEVPTLEQMGMKFSLTRERIRQIESRAYRRLAAQSGLPEKLCAVLGDILECRRDPLWVVLLPSSDSYFEGWSWGERCLARVVNEFGADRFNCFDVDGALVCSRTKEEDFVAQRQLFQSLARDVVRQRPTKFELEVLAESLALNCAGRELHSEIFRSAEPYLQFARLPGSRESVLVGFGRGIEHVVTAVLEESEEPLHYSEIHRRAVARLDAPVEVRRVHAALTQAGVHLFGRGTYGLMRHLRASEEEVGDVLEAAEEIVLSGDPDRQWHAQELIEALPFEAGLRGAEMNAYDLNVILSTSHRLRYLGRMVWVAHSSAHKDSGDRIDIAQACTRLLREAGRPLMRTEIMGLLKDWRGLGRHFQLHGRTDLIALAPGLWGLRERDLPLTDWQVASLLDALHLCLAARGKGLHQSEVLEALRERSLPCVHAVQAYWVFSLATADVRFRLSHGGYVGLEEWNGSRRVSILQAAKRIAKCSQSASRIEDLRRQMTELVERDVSCVDTANALRDAGFAFDGLTGTWMVSDDALDEEESVGDEQCAPSAS